MSNTDMSKPKIIAYIGCMVDEKGMPVGMKSVGKDTTADFARNYLISNHIRVKHIAFADPIKDMVSEAYSLERSKYDTFELKDVELSEYPGWTYRKFLNYIGTNVGRQAKPTLWTDLVRERIEKELDPLSSVLGEQVYSQMMELGIPIPHQHAKVIQVTDVRFKNEYDMLKKLGAIFILVRRPKPADMELIAHESNTYNPDLKCDYVIENNGSPEMLQNQTIAVMQHIYSQ